MGVLRSCRSGCRAPWPSALALAPAVAIASFGCGDSDSVTPSAPNILNLTGSVLTTEILMAMNTAIQDEYRAEETYLRMIDDFGEVQPFANIVLAEERHSDSIAKLFVTRGLDVPASQWGPGDIPRFRTLSEACAAGVEAEEHNVAMYDEFLTRSLPADVRNVFENVRAASLNNHLPAFETCCGCSP